MTIITIGQVIVTTEFIIWFLQANRREQRGVNIEDAILTTDTSQ